MAFLIPAQRFELLWALVLVFVLAAVTFLFKLYRARKIFWRLRKQGLPMPPWHPLWGHIHLVSKILSELPRGASPMYLADEIRRRFPDLRPSYYLDLWPLHAPFLIITSPTLARQFQQHSPTRPLYIVDFMRSITGGLDLFSMEGQSWKYWRGIYATGFSLSHIMKMVPDMMEEVLVFRDVLREKASQGDIVTLESTTLNLSMDLIGRVVLDTSFGTQRGYNDMIAALRSQLMWADALGLQLVNISIRPLVSWYNTRRMNRYLKPELAKRYGVEENVKKNNKSIVDLAFNNYMCSNSKENGRVLDSTFATTACATIKMFIFAGHDTTSTTLCYAYHLLSSHPNTLRLLRQEHDKVFGKTLSTTAATIKSNPHLLNHLPYTLAVVKETLRLYPPGETLRDGSKDIILSDDGLNYLTEHVQILVLSHPTHRHPKYWPRPTEFLPERFFAAAEDEVVGASSNSGGEGGAGSEILSSSEKEAWRAFGRGSRVCIGQELALTELKLILALTAREFDIVSAYAEFDAGKKGKWDVHGDKAFMAMKNSGHPREGMPARVKFADWESDG